MNSQVNIQHSTALIHEASLHRTSSGPFAEIRNNSNRDGCDPQDQFRNAPIECEENFVTIDLETMERSELDKISNSSRKKCLSPLTRDTMLRAFVIMLSICVLVAFIPAPELNISDGSTQTTIYPMPKPANTPWKSSKSNGISNNTDTFINEVMSDDESSWHLSNDTVDSSDNPSITSGHLTQIPSSTPSTAPTISRPTFYHSEDR